MTDKFPWCLTCEDATATPHARLHRSSFDTTPWTPFQPGRHLNTPYTLNSLLGSSCCSLHPADPFLSSPTDRSFLSVHSISNHGQRFPPGGTFFDTLKKSFTDVPVDALTDNAISTTEFLEAAESLVTLFDVLGSVAFNPVKSDMTGNIKKIRDRQLAAPTLASTLQELVINELKEKKHTATEGLLWLTRGLDFTAQALRQNITVPSEELSASFRAAYGNTLKPHHSFIIKPIFSAAMGATPYRKDFYKKLGDDETKVNAELEKWLAALEKVIGILKEFMARKEAKW
ncbi:glycolipid transfer protein domain-containing protein [Clohesyomyces aquaticus]|uniref:Glycolipid transfer protein domain-containing protein n=1 Tax=Clohesyomyces aquaticus TaxID=1231657 RepID=A0A1Y2A8U7_9PLEO|nr:glycolipid transfer protein domain-containing protein [Clohesyomyces aquaticus]